MIVEVFSKIPIELWKEIVRREPEWLFMEEFLRLGFGKFAVLMVSAGLNDFKLKGKAEKVYWFRNSKNLRLKGFNSISDLKTVLGEFYMHERLAKQKLRRLERFLTSKLAEKLWNSNAEEVAKNFTGIRQELAETMGQDKTAKTIVFAMKCLGIALLMRSNSNFTFVAPIPVDYRIRELTKRLGVKLKTIGALGVSGVEFSAR
ncbi:MAG: N-glycosylase/DNA lyase [Archaeoglobaceae archaeon]